MTFHAGLSYSHSFSLSKKRIQITEISTDTFIVVVLTGFEPVDVFPIDNTLYRPYRKTI